MNVDRLIDANFLIDLWRRGEGSAAATYAAAHAGESFAMCWIVKGEFLRAASLAGQSPDDVGAFLARFPTHWPDDALLVIYAKLAATLHAKALSLSAHDLWVAASALRLGVPLVTRNAREFAKVDGLQVDPY